MRLHDQTGQRKYPTGAERNAFLRAAARHPRSDVRNFCETLAHAGCRLSEALNLTISGIDTEAGVLVFESLKKRRKGIFRAVPVPQELLQRLKAVHGTGTDGDIRLWNWSRTTGWRRVVEVMKEAGIEGMYATPKGLRHGFAILAVTSEVPLNMIQRWLGHSRLEITSIYANAVGPEERRIAERMWRGGTYTQQSIQPCVGAAYRVNACWMMPGFNPCTPLVTFRI